MANSNRLLEEDKWLAHWSRSDGIGTLDKVLQESQPLDPGQWEQAVRHLLTSRYGNVPQHDMMHVAEHLGLLKDGKPTRDAPEGGYTRASAEEFVTQMGETWQELRSAYQIPAPPIEDPEEAEWAKGLTGDLKAMQARSGWGSPTGDGETWQQFEKETFGGPVEDGELGSLAADLATLQKQRGLT